MFAAGGVKSPVLDVVFEQLDVIGPRQWLGLLTGFSTGWARRVMGPIADQVHAPHARQAELAPANDNTRADELAQAS
jgi:hypothetical protein